MSIFKYNILMTKKSYVSMQHDSIVNKFKIIKTTILTILYAIYYT